MIPQTIQSIQQQLGHGLTGAMVYVGASHPTYLCKHEYGGAESKVLENGMIDAPVSLSFKVNGKRGQGWRIFISLEPSDTYTVRLWKSIKTSLKKTCKLLQEKKIIPVGEVLDTATDIYCDQLQECVEGMYDRAIKAHNQGFIPLD